MQGEKRFVFDVLRQPLADRVEQCSLLRVNLTAGMVISMPSLFSPGFKHTGCTLPLQLLRQSRCKACSFLRVLERIV